MKNKIMLLTLYAMLLALSVPVEAQQPKKVFRIGYLSSNAQASDSLRAEGIRAAFGELGYIDGQNLAIEYRYADNKLDRLPELAADLVRLNVDVIVVAGGDTVVRPAMNATKTISIVLIGASSDPVKAGFVQSLARPGGNVTGITSFSTDLGGKRLELIKEAVPKVARIAVLYDPSAPGFAREVKEDLPVAARALKLTVQPWEVRAAADLDKVFAAKPADLPVEQPTKFEFVINLKTAKQIGLTIPPDLLARATKIIR